MKPHAGWLPCLVCAALLLVMLSPALPDEPLRTPPPGPLPRINGPRVYGCRPGRPFLFRIPCTGQRPISLSASNLPPGIALNPRTGILSGASPAQPGEYAVQLTAANAAGSTSRPFRIVVGETLALTPPMGWNDWYTHYDRITDARIRAAASAMIDSGMADYGYSYVNIDDCWARMPGSSDPDRGAPARDPQGRILPNARFPDMNALTDFIHEKGLKAGIYSSPGPLTCASYAGSYQHEEQDARTFAEWGFDFLKYDWCSYGKVAGGDSLAHLQAPYRQMGEILKSLPRDLVFNLCQYGMGDVWNWGAKVGGHSWRTTGDLGLEKAGRLPGFFRIALANARHWDHAGPGRWNDPDYILIGVVGNAHQIQQEPRRASLTPDEMYAYMSLWSLMAAPLFYSGDIEKLDPLTLNVLCNAEVIDVNQDPLGKQARIVRQDDSSLILARPLEDGALAVGLFNLGEDPRIIQASWAELLIQGPQTPRDLWRQRDRSPVQDQIADPVPPHGASLLKLTPSS
jgi:alpha-galactosidase